MQYIFSVVLLLPDHESDSEFDHHFTNFCNLQQNSQNSKNTAKIEKKSLKFVFHTLLCSFNGPAVSETMVRIGVAPLNYFNVNASLILLP